MHLWGLNIFNRQIKVFYEVPSNSFHQATNNMGAINSSPEWTIWHVDHTSESTNETGVCFNIVEGTSNYNFLKYRHLKKVSSTLDMFWLVVDILIFFNMTFVFKLCINIQVYFSNL